MALYKKTINGKPYYYLRTMARVEGKPKMVSERYLGTAADLEKMLDASEVQLLPERTRHLGFGDSAGVWEILHRLGVAVIRAAQQKLLAQTNRRARPMAGLFVNNVATHTGTMSRLITRVSEGGYATYPH